MQIEATVVSATQGSTMKMTVKKTIALLLTAGTCCLVAAAETVQGVLEKSAPYSALFSVSSESGDLIGYPFKNQSPVGKAILGNCLPGMLCTIGKAATRNMDNTEALKFADQPAQIPRAAWPAMPDQGDRRIPV